MRLRQLSLLGTAVLGLATLFACNTAVQAPVLVTGITVSPESSILGVGSTLQLTAETSPAAAAIQSVTWTSGSEGVAGVDSAGLVTAVSGGVATITVKSVSDPTRFTTCTITVLTVAAKKSELDTAIKAALVQLQNTGVGVFVGMVPGSVSSAYSDAIGTALEVQGDATATFPAVEAAISDLAAATRIFSGAKITALGASKSALDAAITSASTLKTATSVGTGVGQVNTVANPTAVSDYTSAISAAATASASTSATPVSLDNAKAALAAATAAFRLAIVVPDNLYVYVDVPSSLSGTSATLVGVVSPSAFAGAGLTKETTAGNALEGNNSLAISLTADGQGFSFVSAENDLTRYSKLRFSIKTTSTINSVLKLALKMVGQESSVGLAGLGIVADGAFHEVAVPLSSFSGLNLAVVNVPFQIMAVGGASTFTAQIDKIYFSKN